MFSRLLCAMLCLWICAANGSAQTVTGFERWKGECQSFLQDKSVIAYYDFQDKSETTVKNRSKEGASLDGTIQEDGKVHGPEWGLGRWSGKKALLFDPGSAPAEGSEGDVPSSCFVEIPFQKALFPLDKATGGTGEMTIEGWFKVSTLEGGAMGLVDKSSEGSSVNSPYALWCNSGRVTLYICRLPDGKQVQLGDNEALVKGKWTHVAVTITADRCALYRDGRRCAADTLNGVPTDNERPLIIGAMGKQAFPFHGWIDELVIYNRALTEEEIKKRASLASEDGK